MNVLVDTSVWSLALRRRAPSTHASVDRLRALIDRGTAHLMGPIRQELLSGIRERSQYERLRTHLSAFPDLALDHEDFALAADAFNRCRGQGVQGSHTDFLICAVSMRRRMAVLTVDEDFRRFVGVLPVVLDESG